MLRKKSNKLKTFNNVVSKDNVVSTEDLPYPVVFYPGHYGTFFGFKQNHDSKLTLCSCSKVAIINYIKSITYDSNISGDNTYEYFNLETTHFPKELVDYLINIKAPYKASAVNYMNFEDCLCHECNKKTPEYSYCVPMYGSVFMQTYGWYVNKNFFSHGIISFSSYRLSDISPELREDFLLDFTKTNDNIDLLYQKGHKDKAQELSEKLHEQRKKINKIIENEVRERFGYKRIGEAWTSETKLYYIIKELYPDNKVIRHHRPSFLDRLELDIYIEDLRLGIEYQGIQHFKPIEHWGGEKALEKTKFRDKKKFDLCKKNNIVLIYFYYYENLSKEDAREKLANIGF